MPNRRTKQAIWRQGSRGILHRMFSALRKHQKAAWIGLCMAWSLPSLSAAPTPVPSVLQTSVSSTSGVATPSSTTLRMLLIPIDDRPATGQFAQMIGQIAGVQVEMPPERWMGRFLEPGDPDRILDWLAEQPLGRYDAVIVSTDMIQFGGLIASRVPDVDVATATARLQRLTEIRRRTPGVPFYAFSSLMRLAPTSTLENRAWREILTRAVLARSRFLSQPSLGRLLEWARLTALLPEGEFARYDQTRSRNHEIQRALIHLTDNNVFDYLIIGQDDAQPEGPHLAEGQSLQQLARTLETSERVYFCEGIDQHANVLVSRALLRRLNYTPRIRIVYADPLGTTITPPYESQPLSRSIGDQILASGARLATGFDDADYTLYINTPEPRETPFRDFIHSLQTEVEMGFPIAVADLNLGKTGTGDPRLFQALTEGDRAMRLLAYAGWNTAGNTLGTTIPAANVTLAARRLPVDPLEREVHQRAFLLHRLVNDFEYHRFTRPLAYAFIDNNPPATREETYGERLDAVNELVASDLSRRLDEVFRSRFQGRRFFVGPRQFEFQGLRNVDVELPWPRAYEVRLDFQLIAREVRP